MKPCNCGGFWQGVFWVHAERCDRPRNQDFTSLSGVRPTVTDDDMVARWKSMPGRPPNPNSQRERAKVLGIPRSTLRRREKGAKPRKPAPVVSRCEVIDVQCEVTDG